MFITGTTYTWRPCESTLKFMYTSVESQRTKFEPCWCCQYLEKMNTQRQPMIMKSKGERDTSSYPDVARPQFSPDVNTVRNKVGFPYSVLHSLHQFYLPFFPFCCWAHMDTASTKGQDDCSEKCTEPLQDTYCFIVHATRQHGLCKFCK